MERPQRHTSFPTPPRPDRRRRRIAAGIWILVVGIAVGALLAGLGAAAAGTSTHRSAAVRLSGPTWPGPESGHGGFRAHGWIRHGFFGPFRGGPSFHGQFTVRIPGHGSRTFVFQRGVVTSVSGSSIGVKSDDGYSASYPLDDRTLVVAGLHGIGDVRPGDVVGVFAVRTGSTTRVVRVFDETALPRARGGLFPWKPDHPPGIFPG